MRRGQHRVFSAEPEFGRAFPSMRLVQRSGSCACDGNCPRCKDDSLRKMGLEIGSPHDAFEREADKIADQVLQSYGLGSTTGIGHVSTIQRKCGSCSSPGDICPECAAEEKEKDPSLGLKDKTHLQAKTSNTRKNNQFENQNYNQKVPSIVKEVLQSPGQSLDSAARAFFEPRFRHDFSHVRVHTDIKAAQSAEAVKALAYTVGDDMVFGSGQYAPWTTSGTKMIAHELTHVVQQSGKMSQSAQEVEMTTMGKVCKLETSGQAFQPLDSDTLPNRNSPINSSNVLQRTPTFGPECNDFQRCNVIEPLVHAKQMVDAAISELGPVAAGTVTSGRIIDLLNVHFRVGAVADSGRILGNFQTIRRELDSPIRYVCYKQPPGDCRSEKGIVGAFTDFAPSSDVHLCPAYHIVGCVEDARQLVHEIAHHLGTFDHAYVDQAEYDALSHEKAMQNADTYAQFTKMVFRGAASCRDCGDEIQLRHRKY